MERKNPRFSLRISTEGRILIAGCVLLVSFLSVLAFFFRTHQETANALLLAFAAHCLGGRAAGIGICMARGFGKLPNIAYNLFLESLIICFSYSLFVLSMQNQLKSKWLRVVALNAAQKAHKHERIISKYRWIGLFLFVMIPFPVTGPVMGSIVGYFLGLSPKRNLSAVFGGTLASTVAWVFFFDFLDKQLHVFKYAFWILIFVAAVYFSKTIRQLFTKQIANQ